ncbi:hypothetical protein [Thiocapsa bogorovii]|nr:hypothetical protein [Thiocapsa bogorovii]
MGERPVCAFARCVAAADPTVCRERDGYTLDRLGGRRLKVR